MFLCKLYPIYCGYIKQEINIYINYPYCIKSIPKLIKKCTKPKLVKKRSNENW